MRHRIRYATRRIDTTRPLTVPSLIGNELYERSRTPPTSIVWNRLRDQLRGGRGVAPLEDALPSTHTDASFLDTAEESLLSDGSSAFLLTAFTLASSAW